MMDEEDFKMVAREGSAPDFWVKARRDAVWLPKPCEMDAPNGIARYRELQSPPGVRSAGLPTRSTFAVMERQKNLSISLQF